RCPRDRADREIRLKCSVLNGHRGLSNASAGGLDSVPRYGIYDTRGSSHSRATVTLDVKNMNCDLCPITVRKSLERVPGVAQAKVDFAQKTAVVKFDPTKVSTAALEKATTDAGFPSAARP